jgi:curved DNA-binding protein CbpA
MPDQGTDLREWMKRVDQAHEAMERNSYYRLLAIPDDAPLELIRRAYHRRAMQLHPDRHRDTAEPARSRVYALFKRMTEAYRVLSDPEERRRYDAGLAQGRMRLEDEVTSEMPGGRRPEDRLRTPAGRRHFQAAAEAVAKGDFGAAELNLKLAIGHEGELPFLAEMMAQFRRRKGGG